MTRIEIINLRHPDGRTVCIHDMSAWGQHSPAFTTLDGKMGIMWIVQPATVPEYIEMMEAHGFAVVEDAKGIDMIRGMALVNDPRTPMLFWGSI